MNRCMDVKIRKYFQSTLYQCCILNFMRKNKFYCRCECKLIWFIRTKIITVAFLIGYKSRKKYMLCQIIICI